MRLFGLLVIAALAFSLFFNKAYHVDDALFLAAADQIERDPPHPYAFEINWFGQPISMWKATQNPPLTSYLLALVRKIGIRSERGLHGVFLILALGSIALSYRIARAFGSEPLWIASSVLAAPAFFVSATNLMADILLMTTFLAALQCWLRALETGRFAWWAGASVMITFAVLTKYFGAALFALLPALSWSFRRRWISHLPALVLPFLIFFLWNAHSYSETGHFHALGAAQYSVENAWKGWFHNIGIAAAFFGGGFWFPILIGPICIFLHRGKLFWAIPITLGLGVLLWKPEMQGAASPARVAVQWGVMAFGAVATWLALIPCPGKGLACGGTIDRKQGFLLFWLGTVWVFAIFLNWTVSARALLPGLLPSLILIVPRLESFFRRSAWRRVLWLSPVAGLALSILLSAADARYANSGREIASRLSESFPRNDGRIYFAGHWGLQRYMENRGFEALDYAQIQARPGRDRILFPVLNNSNAAPVPDYRIARMTWRVFNPFGIAAHSLRDRAGFYSSEFGIIPFGWSGGAMETYVLMGASPPSGPKGRP